MAQKTLTERQAVFIKEAVAQFAGPNVAKHSMGCEYPDGSTIQTAAIEFFRMREAAGLTGWLEPDDAARILKNHLFGE